MTLAFLADSTLQLNSEFIDKYNIKIAPLEVRLDQQTFLDNETITADDFYQAIRQGQQPSTSQPSVGYILDLLNDLKSQGFTEAIAFSLSSKLSGTFSAFTTAASMIDDFKLTVIDTLQISRMGGYAVENIIQRYYDGQLKASEISEAYQQLVKQQEILLTVTTLDFLFAGGRLTKAQFMVSNLLNILPILTLKEGKLHVKHKCRTLKKTLSKMINDVKIAQPKHIIIFHTDDKELLSAIEALIAIELPNDVSIEKVMLSPCLGAHSGPHCIAISHFQY